MQGNSSQIYNTNEAARLLRVTPLTLRKWYSKGLAHPVRVGRGGRLRWPRHEMERLLGRPGLTTPGAANETKVENRSRCVTGIPETRTTTGI